MEVVHSLTALTKELHSNVQSEFCYLFKTTKELAEEIGEKIKIPRVTKF